MSSRRLRGSRSGAVPARHHRGEHRGQRLSQGALARRRPRGASRNTAGTRGRRRIREEARARSLTGRGIAYTYRSNTVVAVIAEVEVNRDTGGVWVKRFVCAHDCGLAINPMGLSHTVECGMLHGLSRALWEEVQFDAEKVTSVDWAISSDPAAFRYAGERSTSCSSTAIRTRIVPTCRITAPARRATSR